ncbi:MAG: hypothetical protein ABH829_04530 [archaeon]
MLSEKNLKTLLLALMPKQFPGYTFAQDVKAGAWKIPLLGTAQTPERILRQAFIQVETETNFVKENIEAHTFILGNLAKKGFLKKGDAYWVVHGGEVLPEVEQYAKDSGITIKDRKWLIAMVTKHKADKAVKYVIQTLEAANSWNP